jgi:hypothetical protein
VTGASVGVGYLLGLLGVVGSGSPWRRYAGADIAPSVLVGRIALILVGSGALRGLRLRMLIDNGTEGPMEQTRVRRWLLHDSDRARHG